MTLVSKIWYRYSVSADCNGVTWTPKRFFCPTKLKTSIQASWSWALPKPATEQKKQKNWAEQSYPDPRILAKICGDTNPSVSRSVRIDKNFSEVYLTFSQSVKTSHILVPSKLLPIINHTQCCIVSCCKYVCVDVIPNDVVSLDLPYEVCFSSRGDAIIHCLLQ